MKNSRRKYNKNIYLETYSALSLLPVGDVTQDPKQMLKSEKVSNIISVTTFHIYTELIKYDSSLEIFLPLCYDPLFPVEGRIWHCKPLLVPP